ncbi:MAG: bifunctional 5,10-methylene-tetrahydrofolate dehydrogenase/5,10-methylene-tetrahydrofolate cyclohydrolase [Flavobacteriaceae bacterium]|nr:bifunctional 5,10-methylene-tetrahydrofolate dehydrogenase/5,10-methylene-tetrahydrofolate cyclohydrolase [Flavobacteriaceae bacterium]MAM00853.1 bifunctional 5,10-methylene-tetrahydrofolate dehydrogenase/5,10-methylene-tetrahydrofolate cyclohydrolase [Flavobacteriaceae bacterium]|tara:strand:- start:4160 stop:5038 length:879 start_codon:yes stop_codon:yes gene_type:complete
MILLDGKKTSIEIKEEIKKTVSAIKLKGERVPHLAAVLVGNDGASLTYVGNKVRSCEYVGFKSTLIKLENNISEIDLLKQIQILNSDNTLDGYIVQLPLPKHIDEEKILLAIDSKKDVDGFHPENFGRMSLELDAFVPATPYGIIKLLERYKIPTDGKHCLVVGRSNIVGRPISILMSQKGISGNATVTLAHSHTKNLKKLTKQADIIIMALGIPEFLTSDMVKDDVCVIDVGITRVVDKNNPKGYVIKGDVDFKEVSKKAGYITPVPGGVGPMTIAMLLQNTLQARQWNLS